MRIKIAALLLAALMVLPILPVAQGEGTANMQAVIGEQEFSISVDAQATAENITGQGSFSFNYNSATGQFTGSLEASGDCDCTSPFQLTAEGSFSYNNGSYSYTATAQGSGYLSGFQDGIGMTPFSSLIPAQVPLPTTTFITTTSPPWSGGGSVAIEFEASASGSGYYNASYQQDQGEFNIYFYMENGAYALIGMPGDLVVGVDGQYSSETNFIANTSSGSLYLVLAFRSGDPVVDAQLATMVYTMLSMSAGGPGTGQAGFDFTLEVDYVNNTALYINVTYQGYATLGMGQGMPGQPGQIPGVPATPQPTVPFNETPIVPLAFYDSSLTASYSLTVNIDNTTGTYTVQASLSGKYTPGPSAALSPVQFSSIVVDGSIQGEQVSFTLNVEGTGDPMLAFDAAKVMALFIAEAVTPPSPGTSATITFETSGDLQFVLVRGNTRTVLGQSFTLTENNATLISNIFIEYQGTEIAGFDEQEDAIIVRATNKAVVSMSTMLQAEEMVVEAKSVEVRVGASMLLDTRVVVINTSEATAIIKLLPGVVINGTLEAEALTQQEAQQVASSYGYQAAGEGVEVSGVAEGTVEIGVRADVAAAQAGQLAILEVSADGSVKLITEYKVEGDTVYFNTSSFSTFVPVYSTGAETSPTTTTQQATTQTTTQEETGKETTTQPGETATETTQEGATTPPPGQEAGTTTEEGGAGGVSTAALAVVVLVILAGAAYFLLRK